MAGAVIFCGAVAEIIRRTIPETESVPVVLVVDGVPNLTTCAKGTTNLLRLPFLSIEPMELTRMVPLK